MKKLIPTKRFFLLAYFTLGCLFIVSAQNKPFSIGEYVKLLDHYHYAPKKLDQDFSHDFFDLHIQYLDPRKHFFFVSDIALLKSKYYDILHDTNSYNAFEFNKEALKMLNKRILNANKVVKSILNARIDFQKNDTLQLNVSELPFPKDDAAMRIRWERLIKYQLLQEVTMMRNEDANTSDDKLIKKAVKRIFANYFFQFQRFRTLDKESSNKSLILSLTRTYSPYSYPTNIYFKRNEKLRDVFTENLGSLGIGLRMENGFPTVRHIKIGGAAWTNGNIEEGDIILRIGEEGETEYDVLGLWTLDIYSLMYGLKSSKVNITIRKVDGSIEKHLITRRESKGYTNVALLSINKVNTAYIYLPSFYNGADKHVFMALKKLKESNIKNLIFDIRNNGGGLISVAKNIAGFFFDNGFVAASKTKDKNHYFYEDKDNTTYFDGNVVLLTNKSSASCSEILASALQDTKEALLFGAETTYGKGVGQSFHDNMRITSLKAFRANGKSIQNVGVVPDIIFPDKLSYIDHGMKFMHNKLSYEECPIDTLLKEYEMSKDEKRNLYFHVDKEKEALYPKVIALSKQRIETDDTYQKIDSLARTIGHYAKDFRIPLKMEAYQELIVKQSQLTKDYQEIFSKRYKVTGSVLYGHPEIVEKLKNDYYLLEAAQILKDMNELKGK